MKRWIWLGVLVGLCVWGCVRKRPAQQPQGGDKLMPTAQMPPLAAKGKELYQSKACLACHSIDGSKRVGPTFKGLWGKKIEVYTNGKKRTVTVDEAYIVKSILDPQADIPVEYYGPGKAQMTLTVPVSEEEAKAIAAYIRYLSEGGAAAAAASSAASTGGDTQVASGGMSAEEMKRASDIFFNRCAGCHGMLRKGATGPDLMPDRLKKKYGGPEGIKTVINNGLPGGMPAWGKLGYLTKEEVDLLARFVLQNPPTPPERTLKQIRDSWKLYVKVEDRPKKPANPNWQNFFGVILRDAGKVAIIDGTTKKMLNVVNTGFAVHILRSSATGRYFYSIGRDGRVTMIDLWMEKPDKVAEVKACYDARSVDSSKFHGYEDKYLIVGGYWPPAIIILNGQTLEPITMFATSGYTYDTYEFMREARVAAIVASHSDPSWVVNVKELGYIWLVDYSQLDKGSLRITPIATERYLHDGGWDATKRYVLMAANARNTMVVVDTKEKKMVAKITKGIGVKPHPGRGANINHPKYGPLYLTGHVGDNTIACIGVDPEKHPDYAWKVVKIIKLEPAGGGNLFIKTHPKSKWIWADRPLHTDAKISHSVYVIDKTTLEVVERIDMPAEFPGRAVHFEYNKAGDEVWVSVWSPKDKKSAIVIFDDKTRKIKKIITGDWLITPTGKFNVYNTMKDLY